MEFTRNQLFLAKAETVRGTDSVPTESANAIRTGVVTATVDGQRLERLAINSSISALQAFLTNKKISFSVPVELKGSGAAGTAPEWGPLMAACGAKATTSAGVSVTYTPENSDSNMTSLSIYFYVGGNVYKAVGCMGNFTVALAAGDWLVGTFELVGKFVSVTAAALPTGTFQTTEPVQVQSAGLSFGTWNDAVCRNFSFQSGNTIRDRNDVNSTDGYKGPFISARDPVWSATIEAVAEGTNSFWADFVNRGTVALDWTHGTVAGNILQFAAPKASYGAPAATDDNSVLMYSLSGQLLENVTADNWTITVK